MLTGNIRTQIDQIWNAFWSGGVSNPLSVIEQLTFLPVMVTENEIHPFKMESVIVRQSFAHARWAIKNSGRKYADWQHPHANRSDLERLLVGRRLQPLSVIEQLTFLLFIKRLDEIHTREESKAEMLAQPMERPIFPEGADDKGEPYENLRWSRFKNFEAREMMRVVDEHVFPFLRQMGEEGTSYGTHMKDARLGFSNANLLSKVVQMLDEIPMDDRDTKGDVYEYMLGKIASAGRTASSERHATSSS